MNNPSEKKSDKSALLHPQNPHSERYDLGALGRYTPELNPFIIQNPNGEDSIDFSNKEAVYCLNKALLAFHYKITNWQIPTGYLCPPVPGRADYMHNLADLLSLKKQSSGQKVNVLDIGTGASCIYPIIGSQTFGWHFIGTDIDLVSVNAALEIVNSNACLTKFIQIRHQENKRSIFKGVIKANDKFDLTICNPPFYASMAEAEAGNLRKWKGLGRNKSEKNQIKRNFGGQQSELWCEGGEVGFIKKMIKESAFFADQVCWFTCLISRGRNVRLLKKLINQQKVKQLEVIEMRQGQKVSRFIAWRFNKSL